jgi:hypothetical protein
MPLAAELLAQAHILATTDSGIPSQANLRRAVSSAYYAVFHLLISEAVTVLIPAQPRALRNRVTRSFQHAEMQKICLALASGNLFEKFGTLFGNGISVDLRTVVVRFSVLQQARHTADYDVGEVFTRSVALAHVDDARLAFASWDRIRNTEEATVFLTALAFGARWSK